MDEEYLMFLTMDGDLQIVTGLEKNTRLDERIADRLRVRLRRDMPIDAGPLYLFSILQLLLVLVLFDLFSEKFVFGERY